MSRGPSALGQVFSWLERPVGRQLERWVQTEPVVAAVIRLVDLQGDVQRQIERTLRLYLHLWNLPALSDVRRMSQQLALLDRRLRGLERALEELEREDAERRGAGRGGG